MRLSNVAKRVFSVALAATVAASSIVAVPQVSKKADAASSATAYLCFASKGYNGVLSNHNVSDRSKGVMNGNKKASIPESSFPMQPSRRASSQLLYLLQVLS